MRTHARREEGGNIQNLTHFQIKKISFSLLLRWKWKGYYCESSMQLWNWVVILNHLFQTEQHLCFVLSTSSLCLYLFSGPDVLIQNIFICVKNIYSSAETNSAQITFPVSKQDLELYINTLKNIWSPSLDIVYDQWSSD